MSNIITRSIITQESASLFNVISITCIIHNTLEHFILETFHESIMYLTLKYPATNGRRILKLILNNHNRKTDWIRISQDRMDAWLGYWLSA